MRRGDGTAGSSMLEARGTTRQVAACARLGKDRLARLVRVGSTSHSNTKGQDVDRIPRIQNGLLIDFAWAPKLNRTTRGSVGTARQMVAQHSTAGGFTAPLHSTGTATWRERAGLSQGPS